VPSETSLAKWYEWAASNPYNLLVSYPRSGRSWVQKLLEHTTGRPSVSPEASSGNYERYLLFLHHGGRQKEALFKTLHNAKTILLIRDPRDAVLSDIYRCVWYDQHPEIIQLTRELIDWRISEICKLWNIRIQDYESRAGLIIQYERLCLEPEAELRKLQEYLDVEVIRHRLEAISASDCISWIDHLENGAVEQRLYKASFSSGEERYEKHCLKWLADLNFRKEDNERILDALGENMLKFGYTESGHEFITNEVEK